MFIYPEINPVPIQIGPVSIHWYGLMYLVAFVVGYGLAKYRVKTSPTPIDQSQIDDLVFFTALGVILGGRIGYMIFYNFSGLMADPLSLFKVWEGGMSFHGGLVGVLIAMIFFAKKVEQPFVNIADFIAPLFPIGLGAGRVGNFINGELWGKPTDSVFGFAVDGMIRHPTQLYEAFFEGIILFLILWVYTAKQRAVGLSSAMFLICYGLFRIAIEFLRLPDAHIGYLAWGWLTVGQLLSLPMIVIGFWIFIQKNRLTKTGKTV